jgi:hypothetical protein
MSRRIACRRLLQQARHVRASMDQGRQGSDPLDAVVMPDVRRQRRAAPASCTRLQSWQLPAHAGDARADQELVANEPEGETDQDRCEGRQPRPLCRIPNGRGRHPTANVPGDSAAHCRTPAAAAACTGMRCSMVMRSRATEGRSASRCQQKWPRSAPSAAVRGARITAAVRAARRSCQNAATAQKSTPVWGSSGESRHLKDSKAICWLHVASWLTVP